MNQLIKQIGIKATGNRKAQSLLDRIAFRCNLLRGIGMGGDVKYSGEEQVLSIISKTCKAPYCIFDVGANVGDYQKAVHSHLTKVNEDFHIHCFEPGKQTFEMLKNNTIKSDISLHNFGLSDKKGEETLYFTEAGAGTAALYQRDISYHCENAVFDKFETVRLEVLDDFCKENSIDNISLLKIDVEGWEFNVLKGGSKLFEEGKINCVQFEFGGNAIDTKIFMKDFYDFFKKFNMSMFRITPTGYLHPLGKYSEKLEQFMNTNYFAIKNELIPDIGE